MSPMKWISLFVLALTASCADVKPGSVDISIEPVADEFSVLIENKSNETKAFRDRLFGGLRDNQFIIQIRDSSGKHVELCGSIDTFSSPRIIELPAGSSARLHFPMSFVVSSYCLRIGKKYEFRVGFTSKNGKTDYSAWVPFVAASNAYPPDQMGESNIK